MCHHSPQSNTEFHRANLIYWFICVVCGEYEFRHTPFLFFNTAPVVCSSYRTASGYRFQAKEDSPER
ncbi:hypothetical protein DXB60_05855 [Bacteroides fragilis]|nr:hypothetical protein DXB60_05855 [Bacteroides fragilis]